MVLSPKYKSLTLITVRSLQRGVAFTVVVSLIGRHTASVVQTRMRRTVVYLLVTVCTYIYNEVYTYIAPKYYTYTAHESDR